MRVFCRRLGEDRRQIARRRTHIPFCKVCLSAKGARRRTNDPLARSTASLGYQNEDDSIPDQEEED